MWSYNSAIASDTDQVRLLIGDVDAADPQMHNEEIAFLLSQEGSPLRAAAFAADTLAARYTRRVDFVLERQIREMTSQRAQAYVALARRLRQRAARHGMTPLAGGISRLQKDAQLETLDRVEPAFAVDQMEEPGTIQQSEPLVDDSHPLP